jgi:hypothetical protein
MNIELKVKLNIEGYAKTCNLPTETEEKSMKYVQSKDK